MPRSYSENRVCHLPHMRPVSLAGTSVPAPTATCLSRASHHSRHPVVKLTAYNAVDLDVAIAR